MAAHNPRSRRILTESDLEMLLSDSMVQTCTWWKEVGRELELQKCNLDKIGYDYSDKLEECIREMICTWLKTSQNPTKEELNEAIKRVSNRQARKRQMTGAYNEAKRARNAIQEIEGLTSTWKARDTNLQASLRSLASELKKEEERMLTAVEARDKESVAWRNGENARTRANIRRVLESREKFQSNSFVREFLRSKGFKDLCKLKDQAIEGMLRQALAKIDTDQSKALIPTYRITEKHRRQLKDLQNEIKDLKVLLEKRQTEYTDHNIHLDSGANTDLNRQDQIEEFQGIVNECQGTYANCSRICIEEDNFAENQRKELEDYSSSLSTNTTEMTKNESEYTAIMSVTERSFTSAIKGFALGGALATAGAIAAPAAGIAIASTAVAAGASASTGVLGGVLGYISSSRPNELFKKEVEKYQDSLRRAIKEHTELRNLLANHE